MAPLDWGLGHATRCIPLIHALKQNGHKVWIATDGPQEALLKKEFPDLAIHIHGRIAELAIVERLGMSRTPIRAALVRLEQEGLLVKCAGRGYTVRAVSPAEARSGSSTAKPAAAKARASGKSMVLSESFFCLSSGVILAYRSWNSCRAVRLEYLLYGLAGLGIK